jgi:flagellum-specific peptidoglycan hydrolase FlgJ
MKPTDFVAAMLPGALACQAASGIPASFHLAQAALESGWGASTLFNRGRNIFGVKADKSWTGPTTSIITKEYVKGRPVMETALWRLYATFEECFLDHEKFFRENKRYAKCWKETTGEGWAREVAAAGYATDPEYAAKLIATIRARKLVQYDGKKGGV